MEFFIPKKKVIFLAFVVSLASYSVVEANVYSSLKLTNALSIFFRKLYDATAGSVSLGTNYIFSPISCHMILSLLTLGTGNETDSRKELISSLGFADISSLKTSYYFGIRELNLVPGVVLKFANKIFLRSGLTLNPDFERNTGLIFRSSVQKVNFTDVSGAVKTINIWVEKNTQNTIKDLISASDIEPSTSTVLVNAVYFKGKWDKPFDPKKTQKTDFKTITDNIVDVEMMSQKSEFLYAQIDRFKIEALKMYYDQKKVSMLILLPNEDSGLRQLEKALFKNITIATDINKQLKPKNITVELPKFKIETKIDLIEPFQRIGIKSIFGPNSGLSNLILQKIPLTVGKAIQKAFIEVDELGTKAAAATAIIMTYSAFNQPMFSANRPFFFCIMQEPYGRVLFAGKKEI